jgi:thiamine pyrophosphate-dependent acetolactate synthase large subunit-like protein
MTTESMEGIRKSNRRWQSDVIIDLVKRYGFPYVALNPGASYRGLRDSLVNYGENNPPILLCNHEKIAVQIAHGYARASGKPMIAIVHDVVGLLHAPMGIYYAYLDRAPVFIIGATGPFGRTQAAPLHRVARARAHARARARIVGRPSTADASTACGQTLRSIASDEPTMPSAAFAYRPAS